MAQYKTINVLPEVHRMVSKLANNRGRKIHEQIKFWAELDQTTLEQLSLENMGIVNIEALPRPEGAEPVPVMDVTNIEDFKQPVKAE